MSKRRTIPKAEPGLFDHLNWLSERAKDHTSLDRLAKLVDFEAFRPLLEKALIKEAKGPGGRPAFDAVLMFKALLLQRLFGGLSDDQLEFQIRDRASFLRFLGLGLADRTPDAKTIWHYRECWTRASTFEAAVTAFRQHLEALGLRESPGKMVDASFVEMPKQRNSRQENKHIKETGEAPATWADERAKLAQKDTDARWTKKGDQTYFGYKLHALVDSMTKLVEGFTVTPANVHDSQEFLDLLDPMRDRAVWADSAYLSAEVLEQLERDRITAHINKRAYRNKPLSDEDRVLNRLMSRIRARVEHAFALMTNSLDLMRLRCIGITRVTGMLSLGVLAHNMLRAEQIFRLKLKVS